MANITQTIESKNIGFEINLIIYNVKKSNCCSSLCHINAKCMVLQFYRNVTRTAMFNLCILITG